MTIKNGNIVRGIKPIQLIGYAMPCDAGYQYTVRSVNPDETITIYRDECAGVPHYATVTPDALEPAYVPVNGTYYSTRALPEVIMVLEQCRANSIRIHVSYGYTELDAALGKNRKAIGEDWQESFETQGRIGRSRGPIKVPLLIHNRRSMGGGPIDGSHIVRIKVAGKNGRILWQHPKYHITAR